MYGRPRFATALAWQQLEVCGHVSGLLARYVEPLALMESAYRLPNAMAGSKPGVHSGLIGFGITPFAITAATIANSSTS